MIQLRFLTRLETLFSFFALLIFSGGFIFVLRPSESTTVVEGDAFARALYLLVYAVTFLFIILHWQKFLGWASQDFWLWILLFIVFLSILWTTDRPFTLRRIVALLGTSMFGIYFAMRFTLRQQIKILAVVLYVIVVFSLLFAILFPSVGVMSERHIGSWQGVFPHKNLLGRAVVLCFFVNYFVWYFSISWRLLAIVTSLLAVVLLFFSNAAGALVVFLGLFALWPFFYTLRWRRETKGMLYSGAFFLLVFVSSIVLANLGEILGLIGRDATLTGRTNLWPLVLNMIEKRPLLGYGFSGFWLGEEGPSYFVWIYTNWSEVPPHAHNGFLDIALDLGIIGLVIYLVGYFAALVKSVKLTLNDGGVEKFWPLLYLTFIFLANQTESVILRPNNLYWLLYVSVTTHLSVAFRAQTKRRSALIAPPKSLSQQTHG